MFKFLIVFEKTKTGYSAFSPDLQGCIATGSTKDETEENMFTAVQLHLKGMIADKIPIPKPKSISEYILVDSKQLSSA